MSGTSPECRILVVGAGYVGLTTAACFAHLGHDVICADIDRAKVASLSAGVVPIREANLDRLVAEGIAERRLRFVISAEAVAGTCDFVFVCVPTPLRADGETELSYLLAALDSVASRLQPGSVVVTKSTVPVGTAPKIAAALGRTDVALASNPEFLREGSAVADFLSPDRIVIGAEDPSVARRVAALYAGSEAPVILGDPTSAETVKYAANAFLAAKVSFVNALAAVCEAVGADVDTVLAGVGTDHRIGSAYLQPGPGWGGSCLPKDTRALIEAASVAGYDFGLLRSVVEANDVQFSRIVDKVASRVPLPGARIALLGLAFKAGTDDMRDSPSLEIARRLVEAGAAVHAYDPAIRSNAATTQAGIVVTVDAYAACDGASALVVATEWDEFRQLDFDRVARVMAELYVIDGCNLLERGVLVHLGLIHRGVGV